MRFGGLFLLCTAVAATACKSHKVAVVAAENIPVAKETRTDSAAWYFIKPWRDSVQLTMSEVVGKSDTAYFPGLPGGNLNNLIADMVMNEVKRLVTDSGIGIGMFPVVCILNRGGIRNTLPKGNITERDIFEMLPFENELVLLKISGATMDSVLRNIAVIGGAAVAGIEMQIGNKEYSNVRIWKDLRFDSRRDYWIATSDYLANGGDGFVMLTGALVRVDTRKKIRALVSQGIYEETKKEGRLLYHNDERITLKKS
jgi:2',3'-cyclic-nucleotide 2'-phosphodiesterase (5'-nucleotidase family)